MVSNTVIVYYSQARGNTKRIAEMIQSSLSCDILEIQTVKPYEGSYNEIVEQGQYEVDHGICPEITSLDLSAYDTIIVGTPTWWYTMAPAVNTFFKEQNLKGKTVIPFQTHGGWPGTTLEDMKEKSATTCKLEKAIQFDSTGGSELIAPLNEIENWIQSIKKEQ